MASGKEMVKRLKDLPAEEFQFIIKRLGSAYAQDKGIKVDPKRFMVEVGKRLVKVVIDVATQEEDLAKYPSTWWDAFKERWYPKWLLKRFPVEYDWIWARHTYPEVEVPPLGKEFVTLRVIKGSIV